MATLENRLIKLEAPHVQTGPVLILVGTPPTEEQREEIRRAREAGLSVVFMTHSDERL